MGDTRSGEAEVKVKEFYLAEYLIGCFIIYFTVYPGTYVYAKCDVDMKFQTINIILTVMCFYKAP